MIPHSFDAQILSRPEAYLGSVGLTAVRRARVSVIGVGAVGAGVVEHLALAGCGTLTVIDPDRVTPEILGRQGLFTDAQARRGTPKPEAVAARIRERGTVTTLRPIPADVRDLDPEAWGHADLTLLAVDDDATRYAVNRDLLGLARSDGFPRRLIDGAFTRDAAQVRVLVLPQTACLACGWAPADIESILRTTAPRGCPGCAGITTPGPTVPTPAVHPALVAAIMAHEGLRWLAGSRDDPPGVQIRLTLPPRGWGLDVARLVRNPRCPEPFCRCPV